MTGHFLMTVEVGNTTIDVGLFRDDELIEVENLPTLDAAAPMLGNLAERWRTGYEVELTAILASVVPTHNRPIREELAKATERDVVYVNAIRTGLIPLLVEQPQSVGVDRIVNSVAAVNLIGPPIIITSLGTATTFEAIDRDGQYIGGAICPGVGISAEALSQKAALLAPFAWEKPERLIGKTTLDHMRSGSFYGTISMIEGMVRRFRQEIGEEAQLVGTGGFSHLLAGEGIFQHHEPHLSLKGLAIIGRQKREENQP